MPKSTVERYEQILAQDPSSAVFVELAKALIQVGDYPRAIEVCQSGTSHHRNSIMGRVLWGKALISLGRPAEAMEQFDLALAFDRENPYAYSLISEVLLQKGLYRSALPLLRKATALQPNNGRLRQWLEATKRAVAGGPAPILADTSVDELPAPPPKPEAPAPPLAPPTAEPTQVEIPYAPEHLAASAAGAVAEPQGDSDENTKEMTGPFPAEMLDGSAPSSADPFSHFPPEPLPLDVPITDSAARRALLEEVPEVPETAVVPEAPRARVSSHEAEVIAKKYEQELRDKLEHTAEMEAQHSFLARHGLKIGVGTVIGVALAVGLGFYVTIRAANHGQDLKDDLANAKKAIAQDTRKSYQFALERLAHALQMDDGSQEAWALTAYARGILYAEYGGSAEDRAKGRAALDRPGVRERFPGFALASSYYLAEPSGREELKKAVLESSLEQAEVQELAGRILLSRQDSKGAVDRFRRALNASAADVRALVALGDYYREFGDSPTALKFYATAGQISPLHPGRVLGAAEVRLELSQDPEEALKEVEDLGSNELLPPELQPRRELTHGRLLAWRGKYEEAIQKLSEGARSFKPRAFEFYLALGEANRAAGKMDGAQKALESALALRPKSEEAKEALGKVLIARDKEKELLSRFPAEPEGRKISLVRGMAFAKLEDWKRARAELARTQVNGKFPTEAAIHLALADAAEGQPERAQAVLEKLVAATRKAKSDVRVALGNVYWGRGAVEKARAQFEEASKDPEEYEAPCALGRLLLSIGSVQAAIESLGQAVKRNSNHGEARQALGRAYLESGKVQQAIAQLEAWRSEQPSSGAANKALALALLRAGNVKEAEAAIARALSLDPDAEAHRTRAMVFFARGEPKSGLKELERASKINSKDVDTLCETGAALVRIGKPESALKAYEAAVREDGRNPCGRIGVYYARLTAGGKVAARELSDLAQKAPQIWNRAFAQSTLARALMIGGSLKDARKAAEQAIALDPNSGIAHLALGLIALRQKDDGKAREALGRAVELEPSHGMAQLAFADALARSEQTRPQAVHHYQMFLRIGGGQADQLRVKRQLASLKKKVALR